jgi:hypothetical protein
LGFGARTASSNVAIFTPTPRGGNAWSLVMVMRVMRRLGIAGK